MVCLWFSMPFFLYKFIINKIYSLRSRFCIMSPSLKCKKKLFHLLVSAITVLSCKQCYISVYLGCVSAPCSTKAAWEIHWDRMLLSSWLAGGWLHIWNKTDNVIQYRISDQSHNNVSHSEPKKLLQPLTNKVLNQEFYKPKKNSI